MASALVHPLRPIDAGYRVTFQPLDGPGVAPRKSLLSGSKLGGNAPPLLRVPAASGEEEASARGEEKKHLRHVLESETRPKGAGLDRRDDIGGKSARRETEIERAFGKNAPPAAEPRCRPNLPARS